MSFGNNLREVRKQRGITQEGLAEMLGVSRQAISKWESDSGYPETEKLIALSRTLNISLDYLLNDISNPENKAEQTQKTVVYAPSGKIAITTFDGQNVVTCRSVKCSPILMPGKNQPRFILNGIDRISFWGEHAVLLGWYVSEDTAAAKNAVENLKRECTASFLAEMKNLGLDIQAAKEYVKEWEA